MSTMTTAQKTDAANLRNAISTAISALIAVQGQCDAAMATLYAVGTAPEMTAGNALYDLKGACDMAKGQVRQAHSRVSNALITYDAAAAGPIILGGGGR